MRHVRWAAEECEWQHSGEASVFWFLQGWDLACGYEALPVLDNGHPCPLDLDFILSLGRIVEPRHNVDGFRMVDVRVGYSRKMPFSHVPAAMRLWCDSLPDMDPVEAFRQYEEIHPFRDGNGRTGSIIFNMLKETLDAPVHPPNLWNDPRRYEGEVKD